MARAEGRSYEPADQLLQRIHLERRAKWESEQLAKMKAEGKVPNDERWKSKYSEPVKPDTSELPDLPEGWLWITLNQLSWDASYGTSEKCGYDFSGPPVLRIPNIDRGYIDSTDLKFAQENTKLDTVNALAPGDFLVIRTNGSKSLIGRSALVRQDFDRAYFFASYLIRFRIVNLQGIADWLNQIWNALSIRAWIEQTAATSAGQYNISLSALNGAVVPIPPPAEMFRIIAEIDRRLSVIDELEATIDANLKRTDRLRQAILKRAFEGKLVPQDPTDEPASVLLERIRAEREQAMAKPKATPQRTNARQPTVQPIVTAPVQGELPLGFPE
jgi:type I restriction enzyme, S subunit